MGLVRFYIGLIQKAVGGLGEKASKYQPLPRVIGKERLTCMGERVLGSLGNEGKEMGFHEPSAGPVSHP